MIHKKTIVLLNPSPKKTKKKTVKKVSKPKVSTRKVATKKTTKKKPVKAKAVSNMATKKKTSTRKKKLTPQQKSARTRRRNQRIALAGKLSSARSSIFKKPKKGQVMGVGKHRVTVYKAPNGSLYAPRRNGRYKKTFNKGKIILNPNMSLKQILNRKVIVNGALVGVGFITGKKACTLLRNKVSFLQKLGKYTGVLNISVGLIASAFTNNDKVKALSLGVIGGGVVDLVQTNVPQLGADMGADMGYMGADMDIVGAQMPSQTNYEDATVSGDTDYYNDMD